VSSPSSSVAAVPVNRGRALVVAADPLRTLEALGDSFDDLQLARLDQIHDDLKEATTDVVVVVDGPVPPEVAETVIDHVMVNSGLLLALGVSRVSTSLGGVEYAGLKIIGGGRLADLPVTWWVAADARVVDPAELPGGDAVGAAGASGVDPDAFGAQAQILRTDLELARVSRVDAVTQDADPASTSGAEVGAPPPPAAPRPRVVPRRRLRLRYRLAAAAVLVGVGVLVGVAIAELADDPVAALTLVSLAVILLVLLWGLVVIRRLMLRVAEQSDRTRRLGRELDRGLRQLTERSRATDARARLMQGTLRAIEGRLAVVSSAAFSSGGVRTVVTRSAADEFDDDPI
jgi:hypothetical protein